MRKKFLPKKYTHSEGVNKSEAYVHYHGVRQGPRAPGWCKFPHHRKQNFSNFEPSSLFQGQQCVQNNAISASLQVNCPEGSGGPIVCQANLLQSPSHPPPIPRPPKLLTATRIQVPRKTSCTPVPSRGERGAVPGFCAMRAARRGRRGSHPDGEGRVGIKERGRREGGGAQGGA